MFNKLKQFKNLRDQAKQLQNALAEEQVEGSSQWGKIKLVMNGNQEILSVFVDPELLQLDKKEKLETGIKEAVNDVIKKAQRKMAEKMQKMGGLSNLGL